MILHTHWAKVKFNSFFFCTYISRIEWECSKVCVHFDIKQCSRIHPSHLRASPLTTHWPYPSQLIGLTQQGRRIKLKFSRLTNNTYIKLCCIHLTIFITIHPYLSTPLGSQSWVSLWVCIFWVYETLLSELMGLSIFLVTTL